MFATDLLARAERLVAACRAKTLVVTTAESCTGGLVAALLTEIAGSSAVFARGLVTYSNEAKEALLGVPHTVLVEHGAVSEVCARAMAVGALREAQADLAVSVTGIAGPGGGTADKPVGLVHFATASREGTVMHRERRFGDIGRQEVRLASLSEALHLLETAAGL